MIFPYTDAEYTIHITGADLSTAREIHVTHKQSSSVIIDTTSVTAESDGEGGCYLFVGLTQQQTQVLLDGVDMMVEVNEISSQNKRKTIGPVVIKAGTQLLRRIINAE